MNPLNAQLIAAHETNDIAALGALYTKAADQSGNIDQACFYLTHAYVFALERGDPSACVLRERLAAHGREPAAD